MNLAVIHTIPGALALLVALSLALKAKGCRPRALLAISLFAFGIAQCAYAQYFNPAYEHNAIFDPVYSILMVLFPPLFCVFTKSLTVPASKQGGIWPFFYASLLFIGFYVVMLLMLSSEEFDYYSFHTLRGIPSLTPPTLPVKVMSVGGYNAFRILMPVLMLATMLYSLKRIGEFGRILWNEGKTRTLLMVFICTFFPIWIVMTHNPSHEMNEALSMFAAAGITILLFVIGIFGHTMGFADDDLAALFDEDLPAPVEVSEEGTQERVWGDTQIKELHDACVSLEKAISQDKAFLEPDLNIATLSAKTGVSRAYLVKLITFLYGKSVGDFIRDLRLDYADTRLKELGDNAKVDPEAFSKECGYASSELFLRDFNARKK